MEINFFWITFVSAQSSRSSSDSKWTSRLGFSKFPVFLCHPAVEGIYGVSLPENWRDQDINVVDRAEVTIIVGNIQVTFTWMREGEPRFKQFVKPPLWRSAQIIWWCIAWLELSHEGLKQIIPAQNVLRNFSAFDIRFERVFQCLTFFNRVNISLSLIAI